MHPRRGVVHMSSDYQGRKEFFAIKNSLLEGGLDSGRNKEFSTL